jgi:ferredoxin
MKTDKTQADSVATTVVTQELRVFTIEHLNDLIEVLKARKYTVLGPIVRDKAIVYDEITSAQDLPVGWIDTQTKASYRLTKRAAKTVFSNYTVGPHSWKKYLHHSTTRLMAAEKSGAEFTVDDTQPIRPKQALLGVRACELSAIAIQDTVLLEGPYKDPLYAEMRKNTAIIAVNCGKAGGTCFCASMSTGPRATSGFDLALTEINENNRHYFLAEIGTELGASLLAELPTELATEFDIQAANRVVATATHQMGRKVDMTDMKEVLYRNTENPRWTDVSTRCMSCSNCTLVCPTCFCTTIEDVTDLRGTRAERWRKWDSCFTMEFSYIHGGSIRTSPGTRYRQWLTHKFASWFDQFGSAGCVGCGRCITWCPVGIDITEELRAIRDSELVDAGALKAKE